MADYLYQRSGVWHYRRRVPGDVAHLDPRREIRATTRKTSQAEAIVVADRINSELEAYWDALSGGQLPPHDDAVARFERAVKIARTLGVAYRPAADIADDLGELVQRLELLEERALNGATETAAAVLGAVEKPALRLSQLFQAYEEHVRDQLLKKSADQQRKWRNPRLRAINNLIDVIGDKPITAVSREDALDFRVWWLDRVVDEDLKPDTANKDLGHLSRMFVKLNEAWRLGLDGPFENLRLAGGYVPRVPFAPEFVRDNFLVSERMSGISSEVRAILQVIACTGLRPSEVVGLLPKRIRLDANIPHVEIRPDERELKSEAAKRDMPLFGVALEVMREFRDGFPRYRPKPDTFSATANKALTAAGLRPTPAHTVYSLRHTFKDRLISIEAPPRVQDALMGHSVGEIPYGHGPTLEQRAEWMARVWA